jgi:hypothetical protein
VRASLKGANQGQSAGAASTEFHAFAYLDDPIAKGFVVSLFLTLFRIYLDEKGEERREERLN